MFSTPYKDATISTSAIGKFGISLSPSNPPAAVIAPMKQMNVAMRFVRSQLC
jgi:hypothetical protein